MLAVRKKFAGLVVGAVTISQVAERISPENRYFAGRGGEEGRARGAKDAGEYDYVTISLGNVWGASAGNASVQSYEKIGYHAGSIGWLNGIVSDGCPAYVAWSVPGGYEWRRVVLG